jgi:nucleotide-binding universal stress UspA family protein
MTKSPTPGSIVVGIDGSKAATRAALWGVDEAVSRDVPLRLLYAIGREGRATAEFAVRQAITAIEAERKPVKLESNIVHGPAVGSLIRASASAAMICVGAVGLHHFEPGRVGSSAAALATSAHCPVAIIRDRDGWRHPSREAIVVEVDGPSDTGELLGVAVEEALLRGAALRAVISRRSVSTEKVVADTEADRRAIADLDRRLARWTRRYPQLRVETVATHVNLLEYLTANRAAAGLVIVGGHNCQRVAELVGPVGSSILQGADCSLLVVNQQHL